MTPAMSVARFGIPVVALGAVLGLGACSAGAPPSNMSTPLAQTAPTTGWSLQILDGASAFTPGQKQSLRFAIQRDGVTQTDFTTVDGSPLHLIVVGTDLRNFEHLHPVFDPASAAFRTALTLPAPGPYVLLADATTPSGRSAVVRHDASAGPGATPPPLEVDDGPQVAEGYTVTPVVASPLPAGEPILLLFSVTKGDVPVTDLRRDGGSKGHAVILRAETLDDVRATPTEHGGGHGGMVTLDANQIAFSTTFPRAGRYRVFTEIQPNGSSITVANTYDVVAPPERATHEMDGGMMMPGASMATVSVEALQWGYEPSTIRVKRGTYVRLVLTTRDVPHSFNLPAFDVAVTASPGSEGSTEFVADRAGSFAFGCDVACGTGHAAMEQGGTFIVE